MKLDKKHKTWIGIGSGIAIIGTAIGIKVHRNKKERSLSEPNSQLFLPPSENQKAAITFPLKFGDRNNMVKRFQAWANKQAGKIQMIIGRNIILKEDGIFGKNTLAAVKVLLKSNTISKTYFDNYKM